MREEMVMTAQGREVCLMAAVTGLMTALARRLSAWEISHILYKSQCLLISENSALINRINFNVFTLYLRHVCS